MIQERHPTVADQIVYHLEGVFDSPCLSCARRAAASLHGVRGWEVPQWSVLARGLRLEVVEPDACQPGCIRQGWQHEVSSRLEEEFRESLFPDMVPSRQALVRFRAGAAFSVTLSSAFTRIESPLCRVLLQRRFRFLSSLSNRIFWPPSRSSRTDGGVGKKGVPTRKYGSAHLQGSWRPCGAEHAGPEHGLGLWQAMQDVWRWLQTDSHSGEGSKLQSTPFWCQFCEVTETPGEEQRHETEWHCQRQEGTRSGFTPNWLALELGHVWWY